MTESQPTSTAAAAGAAKKEERTREQTRDRQADKPRDRDARLADALRANLRRRKSQARKRGEP